MFNTNLINSNRWHKATLSMETYVIDFFYFLIKTAVKNPSVPWVLGESRKYSPSLGTGAEIPSHALTKGRTL